MAQEPKAILDTTAAASGAAPSETRRRTRRARRREAGKADIAVAGGSELDGRKAMRRGEMVGEGGDIPISKASDPGPG